MAKRYIQKQITKSSRTISYEIPRKKWQLSMPPHCVGQAKSPGQSGYRRGLRGQVSKEPVSIGAVLFLILLAILFNLAKIFK